jgi:hypothetical protein
MKVSGGSDGPDGAGAQPMTASVTRQPGDSSVMSVMSVMSVIVVMSLPRAATGCSRCPL